tara:strand:- start:169283 stop:169657 length:375 start_codon:yes stop_codon:yes gene_type:complete
MEKGQGQHGTANKAGRCGGTPTPTAVAAGFQGSQWVIEDETATEGVFAEDAASRLLASLIARRILAPDTASPSSSPPLATGEGGGGGAGAEGCRPVARYPGLHPSDHGPVIAPVHCDSSEKGGE